MADHFSLADDSSMAGRSLAILITIGDAQNEERAPPNRVPFTSMPFDLVGWHRHHRIRFHN
jgi:hypothetical protein